MENIKSSSKESFKNLVKKKCAELAFTDLMKEKAEKSKMKNLSYDKLAMQEYLTTDILNSQQKKLIYKIRTRMIETPDCYGRNEICRLCNLARDEMSHVIDCVVIKLACPLVYQSENVRLEDACEGTNMKKLKDLLWFTPRLGE